MKKNVLLLALVYFALNSCNNSTSPNEKSDSTAATPDSSKASTVAKPTTPKDTLYTATLDSAITCDSVTKVLGGPLLGTLDERIYGYYTMVQRQCYDAAVHARQFALQPQAAAQTKTLTIAYEADSAGQKKILFNLITLKAGEDIADAAKIAVKLYSAEAAANPETVAAAPLLYVAGNFAIDAYLQAAINNDRLLFICPQAIPAKQLTLDVYQKISKIAPAAVDVRNVFLDKNLADPTKPVTVKDVVLNPGIVPVKVSIQVIKHIPIPHPHIHL